MAEAKTISSLAEYHLLGRSGLRVSPLCLGTMTFGEETGWGSPEETARAVFERYIEAGGNFIDTADLYTGGHSEQMIGKFMKDMGNRDRLALATKFTFNYTEKDPNAGGNSRKHIREACELSLRRLQTDYIDLYWLHAWDGMTPAEEVMQTLDDLVREGKVRYIGLSDIPAWYLARTQTMAEIHGWTKLAAVQLEYSLIERHIEFEYIDAAQEMGLGIVPWSPLGGGMLTGKYKRGAGGEGRLEKDKDSENPVFKKLTDKNFDIAEAVVAVAKKLGQSPAQVAINWITKRPGVVSSIIGATKLEQLEDNLNALSFDIPAEDRRQLDEISAPDLHFPYLFFHGYIPDRMIKRENVVRREPPWYWDAR